CSDDGKSGRHQRTSALLPADRILCWADRAALSAARGLVSVFVQCGGRSVLSVPWPNTSMVRTTIPIPRTAAQWAQQYHCRGAKQLRCCSVRHLACAAIYAL